jgi:eukaryotic-like serine/threonine-protein kinase
MTQIMGLSRSERVRALEADFPEDSVFRQQILSLLDVYDIVAAQSRESSTAKRNGDVSDARVGAPQEPIDEILKVGAAYGPYRVVNQLGVGGMGQVVLAEDVRLGRFVALKSLTGKWLQSPTARQRLMREARAVAALVHPNIATLYDVFEDESRLLLVMEYVEGKTIASLIQEGPIPVGHALRLARQVADAVSYAHDHGVIHCDLKPANIQISDEGIAKVLDFGLARIKYAQEDADERVTTTGAVLGTPGYVAPERLMRGVLNASGDIYSLGVVLFEMVTGRRLLEGEEPDRWFDILSAGPPKASSLNGDVPAVLDDVIERALSIDPALRYQSARELRRDLQVILTSIETVPIDVAVPSPSVSAAPVTAASTRTAESSSSSHRPWAVAGWVGITVIVLTLAGFVASTSFNGGVARTAEFDAETPLSWPLWGFRALVAPLVLGALLLVCYGMLYPIYQAMAKWRPIQNIHDRVESAPIAGVAGVILFVEAMIFVFLWWRFGALIGALVGLMSGRPSADLSVLGPDNSAAHRQYRQLFSLEMLLFAVAWYQLLRIRSRRGDPDGLTAAASGIALTALSFVLLVAPYRIISHNEKEWVAYGTARCYLVGQRGNDGLLFCPGQPPPWNRIVNLNDPQLRRSGVQENVFARLERRPQ